jgi:hypothetical protein
MGRVKGGGVAIMGRESVGIGAWRCRSCFSGCFFWVLGYAFDEFDEAITIRFWPYGRDELFIVA